MLGEDPIRDTVYGSHKFRPDLLFPSLNLVVEFDGFRHYSEPKVILKDNEKTEVLIAEGFKVVRIPYFVQLSKEVLNHLFDVELEEYTQTYPHGFVDNKAMLPAAYCGMGVTRFMEDLEKFYFLKDEILQTLEDECNTIPRELVYPVIML